MGHKTVDISEVAEKIYMIDDQLFSLPKWGSVYLLNEEKKALIDTGPAICAPVVLDGLRKVGVRPEDIDFIIPTHIHLDHAGGVGTLARHMPRARVLVHRRGARHLIDPSRLVNGSIEVWGSEFVKSYGEVLPVEAQRVQAVGEGDEIALGEGQTLKFMEALGHAPHELCMLETRSGGLFSGDALAAYIPDCDILLPFHPPPDFDLRLLLGTIERLEKLPASRIYYGHFGFSDQVREHLDRIRKGVLVWDGIVQEAAREGAFADAKVRLLRQARRLVEPMRGVASLLVLYDYIVNVHLPLAAEGHLTYYRETLKLN